MQPWLAKFRGLSKQGLEQAAHTFGLLRSLNLVGAPIHSLIDASLSMHPLITRTPVVDIILLAKGDLHTICTTSKAFNNSYIVNKLCSD